MDQQGPVPAKKAKMDGDQVSFVLLFLKWKKVSDILCNRMLFILFQNGGYAYVPSEKIVNPKTSLVFALKEEVGTLHEALKVFKVCNF